MEENIQLIYENLEEFNSYIDEITSEVNILGNEFKASYILYTVDLIAYRDAYIEYQNYILEDNINIIYNEFPSYIASAFKKLFKNNDFIEPPKKLDYLIDCSEYIINFLFFITISEVREMNIDISNLEYRNLNNLSDPSRNKIKAYELFTDTIQLKLRILYALIEGRYLHNNNCYSTQIKEKVLLTLSDLNQVRNNTRHSATLSNEQYTKKYNEALKKLQSIIPDLIFLKDCEVLKFIRYEECVICDSYKGDSTIQDTIKLDVSMQDLQKIISFGTNILFLKWNDRIFKITPYLHFKSEYEGHDSVVCTFKKLSAGKFMFEHSKTKREVGFNGIDDFLNQEREEIKALVAR